MVSFCADAERAAFGVFSDLLIRHQRISHDRDGPRKRKIQSISSADSVRIDDLPVASRPRLSDSNLLTTSYIGHGQERDEAGIMPDSAPMAPRASFAAINVAGTSNGDDNGGLPSRPFIQPAEQTSSPGSPPIQRQIQEKAVTTGEKSPKSISSMGNTQASNDLSSFLEKGFPFLYQFSGSTQLAQPVPTCWSYSYTNSSPKNPRSNSVLTDGSNSNVSVSMLSLSSSQVLKATPSSPPIRPLTNFTLEDINVIRTRMADFGTVIDPNFQLPPRLALERYLRMYVSGFHTHYPFLHLPTMSVDTSIIELILAMAAVGAQYCRENEKGVELFHMARTISLERLRRKETILMNVDHDGKGPSGGPSSANVSDRSTMMQTAQALLLVMAFASWDKSRTVLRSGLTLQSTLASLVKEDGLIGSGEDPQTPVMSEAEDIDEKGAAWERWANSESTKRTKLMTFCFFNLHCIVYDMQSLILNSEVHLDLPSTEAEFNAPTSSHWLRLRKRRKREIQPSPAQQRSQLPSPAAFQYALARLFSCGEKEPAGRHHSVLGGYVLICALLQHLFFFRQISPIRFDGSTDTEYGMTTIKHALQNWQQGFHCRQPFADSICPLETVLSTEMHPADSSCTTDDPEFGGPIAFNAIALLRLAYLRFKTDPVITDTPLNPSRTWTWLWGTRITATGTGVGTVPSRALDTRDPVVIAQALQAAPPARRTPRVLQAVAHCVQALEVPVSWGCGGRIRHSSNVHKGSTSNGIKADDGAGNGNAYSDGIMAAGSFAWSITHWICSFECACLLAKWLETLGTSNLEPAVGTDEARICTLVREMLDETEFAVRPSMNNDTLGLPRSGDGEQLDKSNGQMNDNSPWTPEVVRLMSSSVLRVWARAFQGLRTWELMPIISCSLSIYADLIG